MSEASRDSQERSNQVCGLLALNRRQFLAGGVSLLGMGASSALFDAQEEDLG